MVESKNHSPYAVLRQVAKALVSSPETFNETVQAVAQQLLTGLQAECVCIFFRAKETQALVRHALYVMDESQVVDGHSSTEFGFDSSYGDGSNTYLYQHFSTGVESINFGPEDIEKKKEENNINLQIVNDFEKALPSEVFRHLLIVRIYLGDKQLGAIRVINRLDSNGKVSESRFRYEDLDAVEIAAPLLALAFANQRKAAKIKHLEALADKLKTADTAQNILKTCVEALASDETGYSLAIIYEGNERETLKVLASHFAERDARAEEITQPLLQSLDALEDNTPLEVVPEHLGAAPAWTSTRKYHAVVKFRVAAFGHQYRLAVFCGKLSDFDNVSTNLLRTTVTLLRSKLAGQHVKSLPLDISSAKHREHLERRIAAAAEVTYPVLILAPTGCGKDLVAKDIHIRSRNRSGEFKRFLSTRTDLVESQLFGHVRGAFTGATGNYKGYFREAHGGTLFIDEIGDMPLEVQAKVLVAIESNLITSVGSTTEDKVDVRVIAATHRNLKEMVRKHEFREDLYYRLSVLEIHIPPLKQRLEDIPILVDELLRENPEYAHFTLSSDARDKLVAHAWPGNVRELRNVLIRTVLLMSISGAARPVIQEEDIDFQQMVSEADGDPNAILTLKDFRIQHLIRAAKTSKNLDEFANTVGFKKGRARIWLNKCGAQNLGTAADARPTKSLLKLDDAIKEYVEGVVARVEGNKQKAATLLATYPKAIGDIMNPKRKPKAMSRRKGLVKH